MKEIKIMVTLTSRDIITLRLSLLGFSKFHQAIDDKVRFYYVKAEFENGFKGHIDLNLDNVLFFHQLNEEE